MRLPAPAHTQVDAVSGPSVDTPTATPSLLEGAGKVVLNESGYTCPAGPCRGEWLIGCSAGGPKFNRSGSTAELTAGVGPSFAFDLADLVRRSAPSFPCSATFIVLDAFDRQSGSKSVSFSVRPASDT